MERIEDRYKRDRAVPACWEVTTTQQDSYYNNSVCRLKDHLKHQEPRTALSEELRRPSAIWLAMNVCNQRYAFSVSSCSLFSLFLLILLILPPPQPRYVICCHCIRRERHRIWKDVRRSKPPEPTRKRKAERKSSKARPKKPVAIWPAILRYLPFFFPCWWGYPRKN